MIINIDVDPDGDVRATLFEPSSPFAPAAGVRDSLSLDVNVDANDHGNRPVTENDNVADINANETGDGTCLTCRST